MTVEQNVLQQHSQKVTRAVITHRPGSVRFGPSRLGSFGVIRRLMCAVKVPVAQFD